MAEPTTSPLLRAVSAYTRRARARLTPAEVELAVRLLKEVNRRLAGRNLLDASVDELRAAGARLFAEGEPREHSRFLTAELRQFFDAAIEEGLVVRHPLSGAVRLPDPDAPAAATGLAVEEVAEQAAKIVANVLEDAVQTGLMLSPLAVPVAEAGEGGGMVEELVRTLASRWSWLAGQLHWLLQAVRVLVPLGAMVLGLTAWFSSSNPLTGQGAFLTGQAMQELKIAVNLLDSREMGTTQFRSLEDLGQQLGAPLLQSSSVFTLERAMVHPTILYLRHRDSDALVILTPDHRATLRKGRWRLLQ
jgi:hypothetical protein